MNDNYCPECNFILNITKTIEIKQENNINSLIVLLLNGNINVSTDITLEQIKSNNKYKEFKDVLQDLIVTNYQKSKNLNTYGFFNCTNCGYFKNINNGTVLIDNSKIKVNKSKLYYKLQSQNSILPRTKDYICPNKSCKANSKEFLDREAVFYRKQNSYNLNYLCCICNHEWSIN